MSKKRTVSFSNKVTAAEEQAQDLIQEPVVEEQKAEEVLQEPVVEVTEPAAVAAAGVARCRGHGSGQQQQHPAAGAFVS